MNMLASIIRLVSCQESWHADMLNRNSALLLPIIGKHMLHGSVPLLRQQARYMNAALHDAKNQQGECAPCQDTCTLQPPTGTSWWMSRGCESSSK